MKNRQRGFTLTEVILVLVIVSISVITILMIYSVSIKETEKVKIKSDELGVISWVDLVLQKELIKAGPEPAFVRAVYQSGNVVGVRYKVDVPLNHNDVTKQIYLKDGKIYVWEKSYIPSDFPAGNITTLEPSGVNVVLTTRENNGLEVNFTVNPNTISYNISYNNSSHNGSVRLLSIK